MLEHIAAPLITHLSPQEDDPMNIMAQAVTHAAVCCPQCGSANSVTWQGREGSTSTASKDVWICSKDGKTFKTSAR